MDLLRDTPYLYRLLGLTGRPRLGVCMLDSAVTERDGPAVSQLSQLPAAAGESADRRGFLRINRLGEGPLWRSYPPADWPAARIVVTHDAVEIRYALGLRGRSGETGIRLTAATISEYTRLQRAHPALPALSSEEELEVWVRSHL